MGDDVDLIGAGLFEAFDDGLLKLQSACVDVAGRFLAAVVDRRAVLDELGGDASPVI